MSSFGSGFGSNAFAAFKRITDGPAPVLATVSSMHSDGTATVDLRGGGQQRVRTSMTLGSGDQVVVQNGEVKGEAPAFSSQSISIG